MSIEVSRYEHIAPTAILIAYLRTFSDIPLSKEIFHEINTGADHSHEIGLAPRYEARYKLINQILDKLGIFQRLEIAAGFSPRGITMTQEACIKYTELDLPKQAQNKRQAIERLRQEHGIQVYPNWDIKEGNALDLNDLRRGCSHLNIREPLVIINEGLMRYFTMDEKAKLATNIQEILSIFGGSWVTPDITLSQMGGKDNKQMDTLANKVSEMSGIDVSRNSFSGEDEAKAFFGRLGFDIESHSFLEVSDFLTSPKLLNISAQEVESLNKGSVLFVMTPKKIS